MKLFKIITIIYLLFTSMSNFADPNLSQKTYTTDVLLGDSITAAWPWRELLAKSGIVNQGVNGDTSTQVLQRVNGVLLLRPKKVFLMFGINDFGIGVDPEVVFDNYQKVIKILQNAKIKVIVSSTLKCNANGVYPNTAIINKKVDILNAKLKDFCRANDITFVDVNEKLSDEINGLNKKYTEDGIHLNYEGYKEWAKLLAPLIQEN